MHRTPLNKLFRSRCPNAEPNVPVRKHLDLPREPKKIKFRNDRPERIYLLSGYPFTIYNIQHNWITDYIIMSEWMGSLEAKVQILLINPYEIFNIVFIKFTLVHIIHGISEYFMDLSIQYSLLSIGLPNSISLMGPHNTVGYLCIRHSHCILLINYYNIFFPFYYRSCTHYRLQYSSYDAR